MADERCVEHGVCEQRIKTLEDNFSDSESKLCDFKKEIREEIVEIKIKNGKNDENFKKIYEDFSEMKGYLKEIANELKKQREDFTNKFTEFNNRPDLFRETLIKAGLQLLQWAILGGGFIYFTQLMK